MKIHLHLLMLILAVCNLSFMIPSTGITWVEIDTGLHLAEFAASQQSFLGDNKITVLKIDPAHYELALFSAKQKGERTRTAQQWAAEKDLIAVVNAGMYQADYATNLGYMKIKDFWEIPNVIGVRKR